MTLDIWLSLALIHITAVVTPGANFLAVTQTALTRSRRAGVWVARGIITGSLIHVIAGLIGVAGIISRIPALFAAIRLLGAVYFAYAGFKMLQAAYREFRQREAKAAPQADLTDPFQLTDLTPAQAYRRGLLTHLSNPASMLYYVSVFTGFVPLTASLGDKVLVTVGLIGTTTVWYSLVALVFSQANIRHFYLRLMPYMNALFGILWIGLAVKLISS
ncbi:MAG: LysE family translocator [Chloroflexi bacterium]|nr:LysE family translocator [Chloroflexota bacterium]MCC6894710.1 LysE family transporter [Anaerolineae bacterium]